jgi:16S rRNA (cytosine967-C5)-methyltransferase
MVARWLSDGVLPDRMLGAAAEGDRGFVMDLVYGVVKRRRALEWFLDRLAEREPTGLRRACLLVGLEQVFHMPGVRDYAAVNETVAAAKEGCSAPEVRFINAVLRRALREKTALLGALAGQPLAVRESHPDLLADRWASAWGAEEAEALCRWNNEPAQVTVRVVRPRATVEGFLAALKAAGVRAEPHPARPEEFLALAHGWGVERLPGYGEGWFTVQDPSTLTAVDLLAPRPGERVLDACAAPGGKTLAIAERMAGQGELVATDPNAGRLQRLRANLRRAGVEFAKVALGDLTQPPAPGTPPFDAVLLDAPCSNTGVLRRRPDARWKFTVGSLTRLAGLQRRLLEGAAGQVRAGGRLVYSTCSLEPEENAQQVRQWLAAHRRFELAEERQLFPPRDGVDGAYAARLVAVR